MAIAPDTIWEILRGLNNALGAIYGTRTLVQLRRVKRTRIRKTDAYFDASPLCECLL